MREQCVVLVPDGKLHEGCILRGFYHSAYIPPAVSDTQEITKYSDGTTISYDVGSGTMEISGAKQITINCENATVEAKSVSVKADSVLVDSPSIDLGKGGKGVLTAECPCPITGTHSMPSNTVRAKI